MLSLRRFGVSFGLKVVLAEVDLEVPARGVGVLMGPRGSGVLELPLGVQRRLLELLRSRRFLR